MNQTFRNPSGGRRRIAAIVLALVLAAAGGWLAARSFSDPAAALSTGDRRAVETVVRDYILANPEIIPQAMENLHAKESAEQLAGIRSEVETPFPGAVLGNQDGAVTLVKFTDFACGYCRRSVDDVTSLIQEHPDLRVVVRELPILGEGSVDAARMALAASEQGKYPEFYRAMFAAGRPSAATIAAAAREAGIDMEQAKAAINSPRIDAELEQNLEMARQLGFGGTPSWVVGDQLISGAVGADKLAEAIGDARN